MQEPGTSPGKGLIAAKTKILIVTDSAALPSGLAETTRLIFSTLLEKYAGQYELHQVGLFHCYAVAVPEWPVYPTLAGASEDGALRFLPEDKYGQKTVPKYIARLKPDFVFAFGDPQRVFHLCIPAAARSHKLVLYINFDGLPLPPQYGAVLQHADLIITKTEFSRNVLAAALPQYPRENLRYLYSPADTERFRPAPESERLELRRDLLPEWMPGNAFVLGWVGRNQWRKQTWLLYKVIHYLRTGAYFICSGCEKIMLQDWDPCTRSHLASGGLELPRGCNYEKCSYCGRTAMEKAKPLGDICLWLHMAEEPDQDWPMEVIEGQFALKRGRDIYYTQDYGLKSALAPSDVAVLYQIWDCLLYLSGGEGFGLPAWEAMCSGLSIVYTHYSGHGEFISRAVGGLPVSGVLQPEAKSCIWRMIADVPETLRAIRSLYFDRELGRRLGRNGRKFVEQFKKESQVRHWHEIFQTLSGRV